MRALLLGLSLTLAAGCGGAKKGAVSSAAGAEAPIVTTDSGLRYQVLQAGTGSAHPSDQARVTVHYTGWTADGEQFDSSIPRGQPATFPLNRVIQGWTEGVQLMVEGVKTRFWIPSELAYKGRRGAPQGELTFDIELISFEEPPVLVAPEHLSTPHPDATVTESGLAWMVLESGGGSERPTADSRVKVHYTGWTEDGNVLDSSLTRGVPATFPLRAVIPGWVEGLQLMAVGDSYRLWIPEELGYKGVPGKPAGMMVYDVELLGIIGE